MTTNRFFRVDLEPPAWLYAWMARGPMFHRIYRRLAADLAVNLPVGACLLDVGTGPGFLLGHLARERPDLRLCGLDLDYRMIRRGRRVEPGWPLKSSRQLLVADALALPFAAGVFHQVLATFSLHNWPEPAAGVREIIRVLRPGGGAWIYEMNPQASAAELRSFAREEKLPFLLVYLGFKTVSRHHGLRAEDFARTFEQSGVARWQLQPAHHLFWRAVVEV